MVALLSKCLNSHVNQQKSSLVHRPWSVQAALVLLARRYPGSCSLTMAGRCFPSPLLYSSWNSRSRANAPLDPKPANPLKCPRAHTTTRVRHEHGFCKDHTSASIPESTDTRGASRDAVVIAHHRLSVRAVQGIVSDSRCVHLLLFLLCGRPASRLFYLGALGASIRNPRARHPGPSRSSTKRCCRSRGATFSRAPAHNHTRWAHLQDTRLVALCRCRSA